MDSIRIFVTEGFDHFAQSWGISDNAIILTANEVNKGLTDGELGGPLKKKRISLPNTSKRNGARSVICIRTNDCIFFLDGWRKKDAPKKGKEIPNKEIAMYRLIGTQLLGLSELQLTKALQSGLLREVK